ncbi:MAG: hypothetical protein AAGF93_12210 [Cyanobacteria bacterium P01_H01_bin.105]
MTQLVDNTLFTSIENTNNPALFRVLRQLDSSTYELYSFNNAVQIAYFTYEKMAYVVKGSELELIEQASSARNALDQWLQSVNQLNPQ